jgi:hypothetical protein
VKIVCENIPFKALELKGDGYEILKNDTEQIFNIRVISDSFSHFLTLTNNGEIIDFISTWVNPDTLMPNLAYGHFKPHFAFGFDSLRIGHIITTHEDKHFVRFEIDCKNENPFTVLSYNVSIIKDNLLWFSEQKEGNKFSDEFFKKSAHLHLSRLMQKNLPYADTVKFNNVKIRSHRGEEFILPETVIWFGHE